MNFSILALVVFATILSALGAFFIKKGANDFSLIIIWTSQFWTNGFLFGGLGLYALSSLIYVYALRFGELSTIYPLASLNYIWTALLAKKYFGEKFNLWKIMGLTGIILGVMLIGMGS